MVLGHLESASKLVAFAQNAVTLDSMHSEWSERDVSSLIHFVEIHMPIEAICASLNRESSDVVSEVHDLQIRHIFKPTDTKSPEVKPQPGEKN